MRQRIQGLRRPSFRVLLQYGGDVAAVHSREIASPSGSSAAKDLTSSAAPGAFHYMVAIAPSSAGSLRYKSLPIRVTAGDQAFRRSHQLYPGTVLPVVTQR
ncbi:hypothetical protein LNP74_32020 [Klebsiella pneumoniae subsp. pneumoniae]|nr:hypothetical protein [Klebsiella pneumoniae subsp. pneumoniae]